MKRSALVIFLLTTVLTWNIFTYLFVGLRNSVPVDSLEAFDIDVRLTKLQNVIESHIGESEKFLQDLRTLKTKDQQTVEPLPSKPSPLLSGNAVSPKADTVPPSKLDLRSNTTIAVLVVACNRPDAIERSLNQLLKYRFSVEQFPIIVSQDCGHEETTNKIRSFGDRVTLIQQPNLSEPVIPPNHNNFRGYYKISRHYKWMLTYAFNQLKYDTVLVVEDDLDISPDFYEYFAATYLILHRDPTLWCVSAWNDNGKGDLVENNPELLYRTDFFPGLGWMLEKRVWSELEVKWPAAFWDDWMRHPDQRRGRACIRPEISRTSTFGRIGVSRGQFFDTYLRFIKLNQDSVAFRARDLSYLMQSNYDSTFPKLVYNAPLLSYEQLIGNAQPEARVVRVEYQNKDTFKTIAKQLQIMDDFKGKLYTFKHRIPIMCDVQSGVPRTAYQGIVSTMYQSRRVYIAPPAGWAGYDSSW